VSFFHLLLFHKLMPAAVEHFLWRQHCLRALANILTGPTRRHVRVQIVVDLGDVVVNNHFAMIASSLAFDLTNTHTFRLQLRLQTGLVIHGIVEMVASDVHNELARATRVIRSLALLTVQHLHRALTEILADFVRIGIRVVGELGVDGVDVRVDDVDAALHFAGGEAVLGQLIALVDQLHLQRRLVREHIVEVTFGDADDDLAGTARVVRRLATLARHSWGSRRIRALMNVGASLHGGFIRVHIVEDGVNVCVDDLCAMV